MISTDLNHTELIMMALNHEQPPVIPTFTLGQDFFFAESFYDKIGFTNEELTKFSTDGLFFVPPINLPISIKLGFSGAWYLLLAPSSVENGELIDTFGSNQGYNSKGKIPMAWYKGPYLTSEEKIRAWWAADRPRKFSKSGPKRVKKLREIAYKNYNGFCVFSGVPGPFEQISMPMGLSLMSKLMRKKPDMAHEFINRNWAVQEAALKGLLKNGQRILMCGDDYGMNEGLMIRRDLWREFIKPTLKKYADLIHSYGGKFILHSCGKIESLFGDFVELGIDGVESLKPYLNDLPALKSKYGDKISFLGCIDDTHLLYEGTPEQVYREVQAQCKIMGKGGGWVPGPTNFIGNAPVQNIQSMLKAIREVKL